MVLEPDTKRCASENASPKEGRIVRSHIGLREERSISYKSVETSS